MGAGGSAEAAPIEELPQCTTCDDAEVCYSPNLLGTVKLYEMEYCISAYLSIRYTRHVLLCTGAEDWPAKIQKEAGSLAALVSSTEPAPMDALS